MSTFGKTFSESTPLGSALANTLDTVIQDDKTALNERFELEHNALDSSATGATTIENSAAQGRHKPGNVSAVYIGTTAQIAALTGMYSGALAYDTTLGLLEIYNGTNWTTYQIGVNMGGTDMTSTLLISANLHSKGFAVGYDWTNALDGDISTATAADSVTTGDYVYFDLGAVYKGMFLTVFDKTAVSSTNHAVATCSYSELVQVADDLSDINMPGPNTRSDGTTALTYCTQYFPFYGRYVGINFYLAQSVKFRKFQIWCSAV
jgi:hypothetical protein